MSKRSVFEALPAAEQQEFQDCCEKQRYNRKEFEVSSVKVKDGQRSVAVARHGIVRCYEAKADVTWLAHFDDDLADGHFGVP